jgi:hypothetical protein
MGAMQKIIIFLSLFNFSKTNSQTIASFDKEDTVTVTKNIIFYKNASQPLKIIIDSTRRIDFHFKSKKCALYIAYWYNDSCFHGITFDDPDKIGHFGRYLVVSDSLFFEDGKHYYYNEEGLIVNMYTYKKGKYNGTYVSYYDNGVVATKGNYRNHNEIGVWEYYSKSGKLIKRKFFSSRL